MRTKNKDKELNHRHFIGLRLTDVELDLLDQGAACLSVSRSEYLRKLLLEKQIHHQIEVVADMNDLRKLVSEYGKIGSNLNQIAKHFNSGGTHTYTDALIQPVRCKNEFGAFCDIVDRHDVLDGRKNVYIGDCSYCSYNNMAHVVEQGQYFLFRTKDIHSKGLVGNFNFPDKESFDMDVRVTLVRSHSKKVLTGIHTEGYIRFVDQAAAFDYIEYGSYDTYELSFRIVRFPISDSTYECIVTNLPRDEFPAERIKTLYNAR